MSHYTLSIERLFGYSLFAELLHSEYKPEKFFEKHCGDGEYEFWLGRLHIIISDERRYS